MEETTFFVPGEPRGKGRPRFNRKTGHTYTDSETRAYENKIAALYKNSSGFIPYNDNDFFHVSITAHIPIPKGVSKSARKDMLAGRILPSRKPDVDNIIKAVLDALNGVAYKDDSHVTAVVGEKRYGSDPGLFIRIYKVILRR